MPKFRVYYTVPYVLEVEAENYDHALEIAIDTDMAEWLHDTSDGDYEIDQLDDETKEKGE
jgi:predicted urease superfamily metal-dependent hydrolase